MTNSARLENFRTICQILKFTKEEIDKLQTDSETIDIIFEAFENATKRVGWRRDDRLPPFFDIILVEEVLKRSKSSERIDIYSQVKAKFEVSTSPEPEVTFETICNLMSLKKEKIDEMQINPVIVEMAFEGFENAARRVGWKSEKIGPNFSGLLIEEVMKCAKTHKNTAACRQFMGNIAETFGDQIKHYDAADQKELGKAYKEFSEQRGKGDPFIHYENQKIRLSRFSQMDHEPCLLVKIPNSNEFVAADKAKMVPWLKDEGFDVKRLNNGDKDPLITFDIFPNKRFTGGVEEFKAALKTIMKSGNKGGGKKKEEKSEGPLAPEAQRLAEKKKERNRKTRENKKNKKMMAQESVQDNSTNNSEIPESSLQDTPTNSKTLGSSKSTISEMVQKLLSFDD